MGDHPNGQARELSTNKPLGDLIAQNPEEYLSKEVLARFHGNKHLPFLFKVLSFNKALPLQAHPDRGLAEKLARHENAEQLAQISDANHKPEVAVTISDEFYGFVGFRPVSEIKTFIRSVEPLRDLLVAKDVEEFLEAPERGEKTERLLKRLFAQVLDRGGSQMLIVSTERLLYAIEKEGDKALGPLGTKQELSKVVKKIVHDYPEDPGMFAAVFFTNYVKLEKGEGIAVPAKCIHAYLAGDVIECMAWSDNMVREKKYPPKYYIKLINWCGD
jgi:mannose-6-phosphate isomerase